jgi:hypothetical protein
MCVRRVIYEQLGGFDRRLSGGEDWEMWVRIAATYPIWYETEPLALYRMHKHSDRSRKIRTGKNISDDLMAIKLISQYLPPQRTRAVSAHSRSTYALSAVRTAQRAFALNDHSVAWAQLHGALKLSWNTKVLVRAATVVIRPYLGKLRMGVKENISKPWWAK